MRLQLIKIHEGNKGSNIYCCGSWVHSDHKAWNCFAVCNQNSICLILCCYELMLLSSHCFPELGCISLWRTLGLMEIFEKYKQLAKCIYAIFS